MSDHYCSDCQNSMCINVSCDAFDRSVPDFCDELADLRVKLEAAQKCRHCTSPYCAGCECVNETVGVLREQLAEARGQVAALWDMLRSVVLDGIAPDFLAEHPEIEETLGNGADAARAYRAQVRREALEEAIGAAKRQVIEYMRASERAVIGQVVEAIRALAGSDEK